MESPPPSYYTCQACGHTFSGQMEQITRQPTCPKCRTFGKLTGPGLGSPKPSRGPVKRVPRTVGKPAHNREYVEVNAAVTYGRRSSRKTVLNTVIIALLGVGIVVTLFVIATTLQHGDAARREQERHVVVDRQDFERATAEAVSRVRQLLQGVHNADVRETTNFVGAMQAIQQAGGKVPSWTSAHVPGSPIVARGFEVTAEDRRTGRALNGFVMLLYYGTREEVDRAYAEIQRELEPFGNFGVRAFPDSWYVAYSGVSHGGQLSDSLNTALAFGQPSTFNQITRRQGG